MGTLDELKEKLRSYAMDQIFFTSHARTRAAQRGISLQEIASNILNPEKLFYAEKQEPERKSEEKYDCYFHFSHNLCHRYVLITNRKIIICTVMKISRRWQRRFEKYEKV